MKLAMLQAKSGSSLASSPSVKKTRQETLESLFRRMRSRGDTKELSTTPSLTTTTSSTLEQLSDPAEESENLEPLQSSAVTTDGNAKAPSTSLGERSIRIVSGDTLVELDNNSQERLLRHSVEILDPNWELDALPGDHLELSSVKKRSPSKGNVTRPAVVVKTSNAVAKTKSVLGKRGREAVEAGLERINSMSRTKKRSSSRQKEAASRAVEGPAPKRARVEEAAQGHSPVPTSSSAASLRRKPKKQWLNQGLYVGQDRDFDPRLSEQRNKLKKKKKLQEQAPPEDVVVQSPKPSRKLMPMPMFAGQKLIEIGRPFRLPFDVFSPLPPGQPKPDEWKKTQKNVFIGDAAGVWKKASKMEHSACLCTKESGCDENCMNRYMLYECDEHNCNIGEEYCTNRAFSDLKQRTKAGGKYNIGVEVVKTVDRGYGVRANRTFEPHQIITEYTGEIITQLECEARMRTIYKDAECYYLMDFDQGMILDATRGSITRFVNHSCEPNCKMVKWNVSGKPRMALFAGPSGIMTGEELSYDYNFNPYSVKNVQQCRCGADGCRGVLGPRPKDKEIREALKPLLGGGKRKMQAMLEDTVGGVIDAVAAKKRKINVSQGVKHALTNVKAAAASSKSKRNIKALPKGWVYNEAPAVHKSVNDVDPEAIIRATRRRRHSSALRHGTPLPVILEVTSPSRSISGATLTDDSNSNDAASQKGDLADTTAAAATSKGKPGSNPPSLKRRSSSSALRSA